MTFAPEVGLHENVHELDFSSLYPNIICTRNVSPDVIRCDCHSDRDDVPGLGYSICDDRGYLVDVLQPIVDARDEITQNVAALKRLRDQDLAVHPGQDIEYMVVDDEKRSRERVALAHEEINSYDPSYYETELVRAVESLLSPIGWDRSKFVENSRRHGCRS